MHPTTRRAALAREALAAGDVGRAAEIAGADVDDGTPSERAELLRVRAQLLLSGVGGSGDTLDALASQARVLAMAQPLLCGLTLIDTAAMALYRNDPDLAMTFLGEAGTLVGDDASARRYHSIITGATLTFLGDMEAAAPLLDAAIASTTDIASLMETAHAMQLVAVSLASIERYDVAESISQRAVTAARRVGAVGLLPVLLCVLANTVYFTGDHDTALFAAGEAAGLASSSAQPAIQVFAAGCLALVHAVRGHASEVERHVATVRELVPTAGLDAFLNTAYLAEGLLALGSEDNARAADVFDALDASLASAGRRTGVIQWMSDRIEALWRVGRRRDATDTLAELAAVASSPDLGWSQTMAERCRGLLAEEGWREHFAASVRRHPAWMSTFELGRTHLLWAERAFADGHVDEAHEHAALAKGGFDAVGAQPWSVRAKALLRADAPVRSDAPVRAEPVAPVARPLVEIRAFGPLTIVRDNVEQIVGMDAGGKLLRMLVAEGGRLGSEHAIEVLWPDLAPGAGASRLRNLLSRIRRSWGDIVIRDGALLRWADDVVVDLALFETEADHALRHGDAAVARRAIERYRGDLLPMARYDDWATVPRERSRRIHVRLLRMLADAEAAQGNVESAIHRLEAAAEADPYEESHLLRAAEIMLDAGRPGAARRWLERAERVADELGVAPPSRLAELRTAVLRFG